MGFYYDYSKIDGYNCPVKIVVSRRGLGKTFGKVKMCTEEFVTNQDRFIYVVETDEMVKELSRNDGEKFWANLLEYYKQFNTSRKRYFYNKIVSLKLDYSEEEKQELKSKIVTKIVSGTIKINGETAGYIVALNNFSELKRNNFAKVKTIIVDEFISEKLDKTVLDNPRKVSSIIQSAIRLKNCRIYLLGNTVRKDDPILARIGFKLDNYGYYKYLNKKGKLFAVLHFVNPEDYPEFAEAHEDSVAGQFAEMMGETHEEENKFISDLPDCRRLRMPCKYKKGGTMFNIVRGDDIISIKQLENGRFACVPFAGFGAKTLYCLNEKEQGYKLGYHIICNKAMRQMLMDMRRADVFDYYSEIEFSKLTNIIKGV